jgi:hypothetical protein
MDGTGTVTAIHLAPESGEDTEPVESAEALAGEGLRGDRHFGGGGADLTLIEAEALEAAPGEGAAGEADDGASIDLTDGEHRRNVTTRDAALNHLVGERFASARWSARASSCANPAATSNRSPRRVRCRRWSTGAASAPTW